jgi:hypothetical protein
MKYRNLRIAWSVPWGAAAVLLCVLWVRSYWWMDTTNPYLRHTVTTARGKLWWNPQIFIESNTAAVAFEEAATKGGRVFSFPIHPVKVTRSSRGIAIPIWFPALFAAVISLAPWIHWSKRFSLRTLLIATTLVAVALGLVVWAAK